MTLRRIILHNFWWKVFSCGLAIMIWMTIHYSIHNPDPSRLPERQSLRLPILVTKQPDDGRVYKLVPAEAEILLAGEESAMRNVEKKNIRIYVDLTEVHSQQTTALLHADVPSDISVIQLNPSAITVEQVQP